MIMHPVAVHYAMFPNIYISDMKIYKILYTTHFTMTSPTLVVQANYEAQIQSLGTLIHVPHICSTLHGSFSSLLSLGHSSPSPAEWCISYISSFVQRVAVKLHTSHVTRSDAAASFFLLQAVLLG